MTERARWLVLVAASAVLVASCGGGDAGAADGDPAGSDGGSAQDGGSADSDPGAQGSEDGGTDGNTNAGAPDFDPADMPPPGQVVIEVDGQTFTIRADDMDYFTCDLGDDFVNVRSESETQDLNVQFSGELGRGNASLIAEGSDVVYNSFFSPDTGGGVVVEAPHLVYEAQFDATKIDDITDLSQVGLGRVSVTCP